VVVVYLYTFSLETTEQTPQWGQYISGPRFELGVSWIHSISGGHPIRKFGWKSASEWRKSTMILDPHWWPTQACVCGGAEYKLRLPSTADVSANKHYGHRDGDRKRVLAEYGQNQAYLNHMSRSYKYSRSTTLRQDYSHEVLVILHHYMLRRSHKTYVSPTHGRSPGGGRKWFGRSGLQSRRGSKFGDKTIISKQDVDFQHSTAFKLLNRIYGNAMNVIL